MEQIIVHGGNTKLEGIVKIEGAKNAVLLILVATLLAEEGVTTLKNVPILSDVFTVNQIIKYLNVAINFNEDVSEVTVDVTQPLGIEANHEYVNKTCVSIAVMRSLLARNGHAKVVMPGGCAIGKRPIDLHLKGFQALGAKIIQENGYIEAIADELIGNTIYLDFLSVGATQNTMMAVVRAEGTTITENVACELEIVDLVNILSRVGANVIGAGIETMRIESVDKLHAVERSIVQNRIEAGTFMVAVAMTEGNVLIEEAASEYNRPPISKLTEMGTTIEEEENGIRVIGLKHLKLTDAKTMPHPGFPTDMQAQMTAIQTFVEGISIATKTTFENRYQYLEEICRMNADLKTNGNIAVINGGNELQGVAAEATDLRAAAALILVGLRANGITRVPNLRYLDRGHYEFHKKPQKLGANVERVNDEKIEEKQATTVI